MARIIALANQKGGVAKTTTCVNLAASLTALDRKVLLIDIDPQGNATMGVGINKNNITHSVAHVLLGECTLAQAILPCKASFDVMPSNRDVTVAEVQLLKVNMREYKLRQALAKIRGQYDYILIDCPPSLNMLTLNALVAADSILIPMQCEYYALEGLSGLLETIEQLKQTANPQLEIEGVVRTMYDGRSRLTTEVADQLQSFFGEKLYATLIPRNVRLAEAPSHGLPALLYDRRSAGAVAYLNLAKEVVAQEKTHFEQVQVSAVTESQ